MAECRWELPPLAKVTVESIDAPGTWAAYGTAQTQRVLYTVSVQWVAAAASGGATGGGVAGGGVAGDGEGQQAEAAEATAGDQPMDLD